HLLALPHIGDFALAQRFLHRRFDLRPSPSEETLAIAEALALGIGSAVDDVHRLSSRLNRRLASLPGLIHPHIPLDQAANLSLGVAARHHALQKIGMLPLSLRIPLGTKADNRQQILDLREHAPLDNLAQLLIRGP